MASKTKQSWQKRQRRVRKKIVGTPARPRLCVTKTNRYLRAQVIDDDRQVTLASAHTKEAGIASGKTLESAKKLGALIAQRAKDNKIENVVFDRNGYVYHGRVRAVAEAARAAGLRF